MKDLLEVLRVQRHNFLNHLQVISGLLQLKKHDRIMDYILQIGNEYNQDSLVGRLEVPEITAAILCSDLAAGKQGITINKKISTSLDKGIPEAEKAAQMLKKTLLTTIGMVEKSDFRQREIELEIKEAAGEYIFRVNPSDSCLNEEFELEMNGMNTNGLNVFTLKIPVNDNNIKINNQMGD